MVLSYFCHQYLPMLDLPQGLTKVVALHAQGQWQARGPQVLLIGQVVWKWYLLELIGNR